MLLSGVRPLDTSPAAERIQLEIHRSMTAEQKIQISYEMSMFVRELQSARIRQDHPEWTEAQIKREVLRLAFFPQSLPAGLP